mmetsp:Transcript_5617/g.12774  ORF Transcript_5617/g.12774 Transcript_5617/m.12774 type:complete len:1338 (-) Transcript_5617:117-4130(-)|eukprot:CAMPEP_0172315634 /NCGR_PEP_ID=MMETSP1058-20130122/25819_1 /TAXON_ID=83371 /ORGANISM="Detonula confervacea, Strain CCMP 353" /LENGTH=1337 /DNA_ID=CAMNT_0013029753 /DNA_START=185 /DNA_END=4198 /DNA_ORIENTATION=-
MRELRVEDALMYLDQVKMQFGDRHRPHIYNEFLDIMKTFKSQDIDTPGVIRRVASLFHGNKRLVLGFNTFLPEGYRIELPLDGSAWPVYREPGRSGVIVIAPPPGGLPGLVGPGGGPMSSGPPGGPMGRGMGGPPPGAAMGRGMGPPPAGARFGPPMGRGGGGMMPGDGMGRGGGPGGMMSGGPPPPGMMRGPGGLVPGMRPGPFPGGPGGGMMKGPPPPGSMGRGRGLPPPPGSAGGPGGIARGPPGMSGMPGQQQPQNMQPIGPPSSSTPGLKPPPLGPSPPLLNTASSSSGPPPLIAPPVGTAGVVAGPIPGMRSIGPTMGSKQPIEFDHAINYVTTIKKRFASHPEIYRKFLEILHTYQKEQRGIKEVLDEVSLLFADHADLLKEFTYFLPDAVQSQAKAQLDVAAKKAEERAKAREAARVKQQQDMMGRAPVVGAAGGGGIAAGIGGGNNAPSMGRGRGGSTMVLPPAPPTVSTPGSRYITGPSGIVHAPSQPTPTVPSHIAKVPFGATKGRSEDREREISRGAVHGVVSFGSVRPPRRNELNPAQAAQLFGRPTTIPPAPLQPMTSESAFFDHVKSHFLRRDLFPDKPIVNRKQTPYMEFIKCLHLFGAGILNKDELIQLLRGLFIQGNTPKSGANATNATNLAATHAAMALLSELEKVLTGRGPFATQEQTKKFKGKYGSYPIREYDLGDASGKLTSSYWSYPTDFLFDKFSGQSEKDKTILNYKCFCMAQDYSQENKGEKYFKSPEDYDGIKVRRNQYEEVLSRVEDEMHEVDMAIERNSSVMRVLEPVAEEATRLREQEEKDGQPIGRLQYKLRNRALNSIHIGAIARVYGESGEEVLQHLLRNPLVVVPIVFGRLREKNVEWRQVKKELNREWKKALSENVTGSLDVKCFVYKREIEQSFAVDRLLEECQRAKYFAKHPSKIQRHPATNMILPDFHLMNPDLKLALFQPYLSVLVSKNMPHKHAYDLLMAHFAKSIMEKELFSKILVDFIAPWFGLPLHWEESGGGMHGSDKVTPTVKFTPGQRVRTTVGDGQIVSVIEGKTSDSFRYLVKFSFGVGHVLPSAVAHILPSNSSEMDTSSDDGTSKLLMPDGIQVLFATEKIYIFMRLYILLVTMLYQAKDIIDRKSVSSNKPSEVGEKSGYSGVMSSLQELTQGKIEPKDFEAECRKYVDEDVHNFVAIPPLVEQCAGALVKVAKENCLENLYHCSQLKLKDLNQLRNLSLDMTDEAIYRLQIESSASQVFFSHLPVDVELQLTNPLDVKPSEPTEPGNDKPLALDDKPLESDAKRPLETGEENPEATKEDIIMAVEPEQKRMKTEDDISEGKPEDN